MKLRIILMWVYCHQFSHAVTSVFVPGKVSKAKCLIADAVCLVQNRGSLQAINSNSYGMEKLTITFNVLIIVIIIITIILLFVWFFKLFFCPHSEV